MQSILFGVSIVAGVLGSILGLGGGVILVPTLTLGFGVDIRYAIGTSIVSVIATSSGAAAAYVRDHVSNIRVAIFLEVATTLGALCGASLAPFFPRKALFIAFAAIIVYSATMMLKREGRESLASKGDDGWSKRLKLASSYPDARLGRDVPYTVERVPLGFVLMLGAGLISGLLGIGSGPLKVPAMDTAMRLPIKVSSATSNFMIGVTAAASAGAYYMRGDILPSLAAPVALGVLLGSMLGAKIMMRLPAARVRRLFVVVLGVIAAQMVYRALRGEG
jgi:uncharacterized membrane protein YfcA